MDLEKDLLQKNTIEELLKNILTNNSKEDKLLEKLMIMPPNTMERKSMLEDTLETNILITREDKLNYKILINKLLDLWPTLRDN
jgi:hypothetical protein